MIKLLFPNIILMIIYNMIKR